MPGDTLFMFYSNKYFSIFTNIPEADILKSAKGKFNILGGDTVNNLILTTKALIRT